MLMLSNGLNKHPNHYFTVLLNNYLHFYITRNKTFGELFLRCTNFYNITQEIDKTFKVRQIFTRVSKSWMGKLNLYVL